MLTSSSGLSLSSQRAPVVPQPSLHSLSLSCLRCRSYSIGSQLSLRKNCSKYRCIFKALLGGGKLSVLCHQLGPIFYIYSFLKLSLLMSSWQLFLNLETSNEVLRWLYWGSYSAKRCTTTWLLFLLPPFLCSKENICSLTASSPKETFCFIRLSCQRSETKTLFPLVGN